MMKKRLNKNLGEVDGTITKVLEDAIPVLNKLKTAQEVSDFVELTFATNAINTPKSNQILERLKKSTNFTKSIQFLWNTMLAGENMATF